MTLFLTYLRNFWYLKLTNITKKINGLIYFTKKIPFIGGKIPVELYKVYPVKQIVTIVGFILSIFFSLCMKFVWFFLFIGIAYLLQGEGAFEALLKNGLELPVVSNGLFIWLVLTVLMMGFFTGVTFSVETKLVDFYDHFLVKRIDVIRGEKILDCLYQGLAYLPAAIGLGLLSGKSVAIPLFIFLSYLAFGYFFLYLGRIIYTWHLEKRSRMILCSVLAFLIVASGAVLYYFQWAQTIMTFLISWWGLFLLAVLLVISLWRFLHFEKEEQFLVYLSEGATLQLEQVKELKKASNQYLSEGLSMQKKLVLTGENSFQQLSGSDYLNALLFDRYRPILNKALRFRFYFIGSAWLLIIIASLVGLFKNATSKDITVTLPALFFVMYLATFGKKVVQMVFVNCDVSMLYYPFYRESNTILKGFNYRFKQTFYYNSVVSAGIFVGYLLLHLFNDFFLEWQFFGVLLFLLIALSFLFSFHELFVYYLLQPFTGDMSVVSPLYRVVSGLFYWISYGNMQLRHVGYFYVVIISVVSLIYVIVGFIVIYRKASKTFRIKSG